MASHLAQLQIQLGLIGWSAIFVFRMASRSEYVFARL